MSLDVDYKVLARNIRNRLSPYHNDLVGEYKGRFIDGRSTTYQLFTLNIIQNQNYEQNRSLQVLIIDFMKAFNSIEICKLYLEVLWTKSQQR